MGLNLRYAVGMVCDVWLLTIFSGNKKAIADIQNAIASVETLWSYTIMDHYDIYRTQTDAEIYLATVPDMLLAEQIEAVAEEVEE
ncbi:MAG: hypothetical protein ACRC62_30035 [Microcoleus sp.]